MNCKKEVIENKLFEKTLENITETQKIFSKCIFKDIKETLFFNEVAFIDCEFVDCEITGIFEKISAKNCSILNTCFIDFTGEEFVIKECTFDNLNMRSVSLHEVELKYSKIENSNINQGSFFLCKFIHNTIHLSELSHSSFSRTRFDFSTYEKINMIRNFFDYSCIFSSANFKKIRRISNCSNWLNANIIHAKFFACKGKEQLGVTSPCPAEGSFIGYKSCLYKDGEEIKRCIVTIKICEDAKRLGQLGSRKCRCSKAEVLSIETMDGKLFPKNRKVFSIHCKDFYYKAGEIVEPDRFCEDENEECSNGIHFFMTRREAVEYV